MARKSYRVQFPGGSGFQLAGIVDRPDDSDSFPVAVFSHCFTCNKDLKAIARISRGLSEWGVGVLRFDMTGLGGSDGDFADTNFTTNVADVQAAISFANQELGHVATLIGHSFGGAASLAVAGSDTAGDLSAVVTLAAPSDTQHLAQLLSKMNPETEESTGGKVTIGGLNWTINRRMLDDFRHHDLPALIAKIACPTLLLHSPEDETLGFDHALRIMGLIQVSPGRTTPVSLVSLAGADHLLVRRPEDVDFAIATVAAFIDRYARPAREA